MHLRHLRSQGAGAQQDVPLQRHRQEGLRRGEARRRWGRGEGTGKKWWVPCGFSWVWMGYNHENCCSHGFEWDVTNKNLDFIGFEWVLMGCKPGKLWISFVFENVFHGFEWNIMQCNQDSIMDSWDLDEIWRIPGLASGLKQQQRCFNEFNQQPSGFSQQKIVILWCSKMAAGNHHKWWFLYNFGIWGCHVWLPQKY